MPRSKALGLSFVLVLAVFETPCTAGEMALSLEESIRLALERNSSLAVAREKMRGAEAGIGEARAGFLPQISTKASYTRLDVVPFISMSKFPLPIPGGEARPTRIEIGDDDNYAASVSVQQPVFTGFKLRNGYKIATYNADAERANYRKARADLILDVERAYYGLLKAREFEKVSERSVERMEAHLRDLGNMYEVGLVARNDLLKARVQHSNVKLMQIKASNGVRLAMTALCSVLGLPLDTQLSPTTELEYEQAEPIELGVAVERALRDRPEVRSMRYAIKMAEKSVSISRAGWLPNIFLVGNYNSKRPNRQYEKEFYRSWDVTLAAQWTLFDWGAVHYRTVQAQHRLRQAQKGFDQLKNGITLEVTQAYLSLQEAEQRVKAAEETVSQAEENYRVTDEKFKQGMATNTDLLDANTMLTQARMEYIGALADFNLAKAALEKAMGRENSKFEIRNSK